MAWLLLLAAGGLEIVMGLSLKGAHGWTRLGPSALAVVSGVASLLVLSLALKDLPVGTAYAMWTGIGSVGIAVCGIFLFGDQASPARLACIGLIIAGIAGLRFIDS